jgi:hypothetical protein
MDWSRITDALTHWENWVNAGGVVLLSWFALLYFRLDVILELQAFFWQNRDLIPLLPYGIATPQKGVDFLLSLAIPVAVVVLLVALALSAPDEIPASEMEGQDADEQRRE